LRQKGLRISAAHPLSPPAETESREFTSENQIESKPAIEVESFRHAKADQ
jgi:hypothetical protein